MASNVQFEYDIFLSYNQKSNTAYVERLYQKLIQMNLTVWMDVKVLNNETLHGQMAEGIIKSQVFLCCITNKYSHSENCKDELFFAVSKQKPMIILMFERFGDNIAADIQIKINRFVR